MFHMGLLTAPAMGVVDYDHGAFELIGQIGRTQVGMGGLADGRFKTIQDVLAEAKAKPDTITVAMNIGLLPHFVPVDVPAGRRHQLSLRAVGRRCGAAQIGARAGTPSSRSSRARSSCCSRRRASSRS